MGTITIRNVPWDVHTILAERAAAQGVSLQVYLLRELIEMSEKPDFDEWLRRVNASVECAGAHVDPYLVVEGIRQARIDASR
jgi:hypothetical protein